MSENIEKKIVFISYCHKDITDKWIDNLVAKLGQQGIESIVDIYDLQLGQDLNYFMEKIKTADKVLMLLGKEYKEKADNRKGGVGTETQIISNDVYNDVEQTKFIPIVIEKDKKGEPYLPFYLEGKLYTDFSDDNLFAKNIEEVVNQIYDLPKRKKPSVNLSNTFTSMLSDLSKLEKYLRSPDRVLVYDIYEWNAAEVDTVWGFVDSNGSEVVSKKYPILSDYSYERALFGHFRYVDTYYKRNPIYGYLDLDGQEIIECIYDEAEDFTYGLARVRKGRYYGYINQFGKEIIPIKYDSMGYYNDGLVCAGKMDDSGNIIYGYFNLNGEIILPFLYEQAEDFSEGIARVTVGGKMGCIAPDGSEVIPLIYSDMTGFDEYGIAIVLYNGKVGMVNKQGKIIVPCYYDVMGLMWPGEFSEDLIAVSRGNLWGFLNRNGELAVSLQYDDCIDFKNGLASVMKNNKWGCIDKNGTVIIPLKYDFVRVLNDGEIRAELGGEVFTLDVDGNVL